MPIDLWLAYVLKLASGIMTISAPYAPVGLERATAYAVAATYHGVRANVDPYELVGIARNESDFIEDQRSPDRKDCGLTQTRITNSRYSCRQLRSSYWITFAEAAREMSEYNLACRSAPDYDRCRINRYNSGVHYARQGIHGRYYLRILCFAEAARAGVDPGRACRRVQVRRDIKRIVNQPLRRASTLAAR